MRKLECINGLDYDTVMFRNELADLIRHGLRCRVDYIESIMVDDDGYYVYFYSKHELMRYYDKYNLVARKIKEFCVVKERDDKLNELGI